MAAMVPNTSLTGHIESILFENPDTGFLVISFLPEGAVAKIIAVGALAGARPGQPLRLSGSWESNKKFGRQFKFVQAQMIRPTSDEAVVRYLGSGLIRGIGKVMAQRIVDHFGDSTLEILDGEIGRLIEVPGIGKKSVRSIKKSWEQNRGSRELSLLCQELGLPMTAAPKLAKAYGASAEKTVRDNPYRLALDIRGVGFYTADMIAARLGIGKDHPGRLLAGLVHSLEAAGAEGNVALPQPVLIDRAANLLQADPMILEQALEKAIGQGHLVRDADISDDDPLVYARPAYQTEVALGATLLSLLQTPSTLREVKQDEAMDWVETRLGIQLADAQRKAVLSAIAGKLTVITGGPGTGKTTIIKAIIEILQALKCEVALAAPTGRAAKRMTEATGSEAKTIHRLLHYNPKKNGFDHDAKNPLPAQAVIVDEASMLDQWLALKLVDAVHPTAKLVFVGDIDQLPSVGPGNVLSDIIASKKIPFVRLTEIFRQDAAGLIVKNAHLINQGKRPQFPKGNTLSDFYFLTEDEPEALRDLICDLVTRRLPERFSLDPVQDIQVLSPMHRGEAGVQSLNATLQQCLNPKGDQIVRGDQLFRVGDKVMQTVNDYDKEVFNGDLGRVEGFEDNGMIVRFDEGARHYSREKLDDLVLAYAVSVHKSQGSEYPAVVIPLSTQHFILLQRNLLYTAVTRAKKLVVLAGSNKALHQALANNRPASRYTALTERLQQGKGRMLRI